MENNKMNRVEEISQLAKLFSEHGVTMTLDAMLYITNLVFSNNDVGGIFNSLQPLFNNILGSATGSDEEDNNNE